ncbi:MAG: hypothetical protein KDD37_03365 [Bdellovibrionales bacterium]|nr:hypothetical protein [Bdellovibrionales bacterium]
MFLFSLLISFCFSRTVDFSWEAFDDAKAYQIQISTDTDFKKILQKKVIKAPAFSADLNYGLYYYRVRAIDNSKRPGVWSETERIIVKPYAPEPQTPKAGAVIRRFEKDVATEFSWKSSSDIKDFQILISKDTGEVIIEKNLTSNKWVWKPENEGRYRWKVRAIQDGKSSDFSEERTLDVERRNLNAPLLIKPDIDGYFPAYRKITFEWETFPPSTLSHIEIEGPENYKRVNLSKLEHNIDGLPPGNYRWRILSSESKNSPKIASEWKTFVVNEEVLSNQDYYIGMNLSLIKNKTNYKTTRPSATSSNVDESDDLIQYNWYANWQMSKTSSLFFQLKKSEYDFSTQLDRNAIDIAYQMRIGVPNFQQVFFIGLRQSQYIEEWTEASTLSNIVTGRGPILGIKMLGRLPTDHRLHIDFLFHKIESSQQKFGDIDGEVYEFKVGLSKKLWHKIWWKLETGFNKELVKFSTDTQGNTKWNSEEFEVISLGFEYRH